MPAENAFYPDVPPTWELVPFDQSARAQVEAGILGPTPESLGAGPTPDDDTPESVRLRMLENDLALARAAIERIATARGIDPLTGLLNRDAIGRCIELEIRRAHRHQRDLSVLLVDVDRLGAINDVKGREHGDEVLRALALHIRDCTRETDSVGRARSDEFLVVCPETDPTGAVHVAQRLVGESARRNFVLAGAAVHLSCCVGIVPVVVGMTLADVLGESQEALARAKKAGGSRWSV
jgi:diguanylate cyclase (GGDEF)-like protein